MSEPIIKVENLSKRYQIGKKESYYSLRDKLTGLFDFSKSKDDQNDFWALKDVNFEVKAGESVGIIGRNGAGKSTLLKILSRITPPTTGKITMRGRVASLLEVGTGFNPELTGRENIYLNGAILGMSRAEIKRKFDEIVAFAEIEQFLDTPVKRYSSGMYMRLAFAVAAHLESEILIVDEVLAVGDAQFQKKCLGKMNDISTKEGRTILFVSHDMRGVRDLCDKGMYFENGKIINSGDVDSVIYKYQQRFKINAESDLSKRLDGSGDKLTKFIKIKFNEDGPVYSGKKLSVSLKYFSKSSEDLVNSRVSISFSDKNDNNLFLCSTELFFNENLQLKSSGIISCNIEKLPLIAGEYFVDVFVEVNHVVKDWIRGAAVLNVLPGKFYPGLRQSPVGHEVCGVLVNHTWVT